MMSLCKDLQTDVSHQVRVAHNVTSAGEKQVEVLVQLPHAPKVECQLGTTTALFGGIAEQLDTNR